MKPNVRRTISMALFICRLERAASVRSKKSRFKKWCVTCTSIHCGTEMALQADQVPVGHIPRSMTIHAYGALTRSMNPGDVVHLGGIFLPVPYTGFQAIRAGLLTDTYLDAHNIQQLKKQYADLDVT